MEDSDVITHYAANVSHWEDWQKQYRYGIILIIPTDPLRSCVNDLRARYDPIGQAICEAHISLTVPLPQPVGESQWRELESIVAGVEPFIIQYGPLVNYLPHPGVCLAIKPRETLDRLLTKLESAAVFDGAPPRSYPFSPHMTLAEYITVDRTKELMEKLKDIAPSGSFLCNGLSYTAPDENFHFTERRRLELSG